MKATKTKKQENFLRYLEDHLAASVGGIELAKHCLKHNSKGKLGQFLRGFVKDIQREHLLLKNFLERAGYSPSKLKMGTIWIAEKMARLKTKQSPISYSDLSRFLELEALLAGVKSKVNMWRILSQMTNDRRITPAALAIRGEKQLRSIQKFCLLAGRMAFEKLSLPSQDTN